MRKRKGYNYNEKTADSKLEPVESFFINKFNKENALSIDFLEMLGNNVYVLYFKETSRCEFYKCYCFRYTYTDENGNLVKSFRFTVNEWEECSISELELSNNSDTANRCIFLFPPSGVVIAEPIKNYIDNAAPEEKESLKNELEKLVDAEECTPIDKVCAKLILAKQNETVKFAYSTLTEENQVWLETYWGYYNIDGLLFRAAINIKNIVDENDAGESENSESKNITIEPLIKKKVLNIDKKEQIIPDSPIIEGCEKTWQDLLTYAGIKGDFYLRFLPDGFARVYILLGDKEDELKAVAFMYTYRQKDAEKINIRVLKIPKSKTDSGKETLSGATPTKGPVDNTNNEKPAGAGTKKGENTKSTNDNTQTKEPNVDLTTAFRREKCDTVNILCAMVRLYSACAWFMIVVREFIECLYNKDYEAMKSDYENLIGFKEFKTLKGKGKGNRSDDEETRLNNMENDIYGEKLNHLYKWPDQGHVYDYGNCHILLTALSDKLKENQDAKSDYGAVKKLIDRLKGNIYNTKKIRDTISHYDFENFNKLKINVDERIKTIISFIEEIKEYERFEHLSKYLPPVQKLLTQPVSIKFCPKCGEELPGGEYTFRPEPKG